MANNSEAAQEILRAVKYMIDEAVKSTSAQIYNGIVVGQSGDRYNVSVNGETYALSRCGGGDAISVGMTVKVFVPSGNFALAFFIK